MINIQLLLFILIRYFLLFKYISNFKYKKYNKMGCSGPSALAVEGNKKNDKEELNSINININRENENNSIKENNNTINNIKVKDNKNIENNNIPAKPSINEEINNRIIENKKKIQITKDLLSIENNENKVKEINMNINNNLILMLQINLEDINKDIYFLDNFAYKDDKADKKERGFMKEIQKIKNKIKLNITYPDNKKEENLAFNNKFKPKYEGIYLIEIEIPEKITDCSYIFYGCTNLIDADLSNFDFSDVLNINDMFNYCINIKKIKFPQKNIENIINMSYMFNYCKNLSKIELSNFNTEKVVSMAGMFQHCEQLKDANLSNFNAKNVTQFSCMFNNCYNLTKISFPKNFNAEKVMFMAWMFYGCEKLEQIDLTSFNFDNVYEKNNMFEDCDNLREIKVKEKYINLLKTFNKKFFDIIK